MFFILLTINKCFTSGSSSVMTSVLSAGQEVSLCQRNFGPLNHLEEDAFLFSTNPREASSAGFILDGTYVHWLTLLPLCICYVRLATNILNFLVLLYMQLNTTLSVQKVSFFHSMSNCLLIRAAIFIDNTTATNSRRGMVTYFFGVTLDFCIKRQPWIFPDPLTSRKYVDCP